MAASEDSKVGHPLTPGRWQQIERVYQIASELSQQRRRAFLDEACGTDVALREEVESLLAYETAAVRFLEARATMPPVGAQRSDPAQQNHPERHPFRRFLWVATLLALSSFGWAAFLLTKPVSVFGWSSAGRFDAWYIESVSASGPAARQLRRGDLLIELNGDPNVSRASPRPYLRALSIGDSYRLAIQREGQRHEFVLKVAEGKRDLRQVLMGFLFPLIWCGIGLFIGFARPEHPAARLASVAALATGLLFLHSSIIRAAPLWNPLHVVLGYHFFLLFPAGVSSRSVWRTALYVMYALGGTAVILRYVQWGCQLLYGPEAATHLVVTHPIVLGSVRPLALLVYSAALVGMVAVIPWNYRRLAGEEDRRRVQFVVLGSAVAVSGQLWWAGILLLRFLAGAPSLPALELSAFTIAIPVAVAYAAVRHRVFDVRVVIRRSLQYILAKRALQALTAVPIVALAITSLMQRDRTLAELLSDNTTYVFWICAAGIALMVRRPVALWLDRKFFREEYDREQMLFGLMDDLGRAESPAELSRMVSVHLETTFHPKTIAIWFRKGGELRLDYSSTELPRGKEFPSSGRLISQLEREPAIMDLSRSSGVDVTPEEAVWLTKIGAELLIPICDANERLDGVWILGERKSDTPYKAADRRLLEAVARQTSVLRENLRLKVQVNEGLRVQRNVLARLDSESFNLLKECPNCGSCFDSTAKRCPDDGGSLTVSLPVQRTIADRYRIDQLIGRGGMGAVFEAYDLRLRRMVAIKIMMGRSFGSTTALRRFRREARVAASLGHPNVVAIFDFGPLQGEGAFIVMERIHGPTLRAKLDCDRTLTPRVAAEWFGPLLDGLSAAHSRGIIHRDLKPENIIGQITDIGLFTVKILDFGLAQFRSFEATSGSLTEAGFVVGTPGYMSPEQLQGGEADQRSDIFAIGVILAEALTGRKGAMRSALADGVTAVPTDAYELPSVSPESRALSKILQRCLAISL